VVTGRPARAVLATLAVSALAVVGLDDPTHVPESARAALEPTPTPAIERPVEKPNILLVTVDDLAEHDIQYMPHLQALMAAQGTTFTDGIAPSPMCVPARASLLTGKYAHNHGAYSVRGPAGGYPAFQSQQGQTIATALSSAGYRTYFAGKYLNGYGKKGTQRDKPPGWTDWRATVDPTTYRFFRPKLSVNGQVRQTEGYTTDVMTRQADQMIRDGERSGASWFTWVNYVAPHVGGPAGADDPKKLYAGTPQGRFKTTVPDPEDRDTFAGIELPGTPNMFPDPDPSLPDSSPVNTRHFSAADKVALRTVYQRRIEAAQGLDRAVQKLYDTLESTGQLDRTLVVFTSDNGYTVGGHNVNGKLFHYDEIVRIPVLMRGPGVPAGAEVETAVTNPDIAATILAAAGVRPDWEMDGVDVLPWVDAPPQVRVVPIESYQVAGRQRIFSGVRVGAWTYITYRKGGAELYNRADDRFEETNLAGVRKYAPVRRALASLNKRYRGCAGDTCPKDFYPADELAELVASGSGEGSDGA
jgi:arylsulfatase A-like enzyme